MGKSLLVVNKHHCWGWWWKSSLGRAIQKIPPRTAGKSGWDSSKDKLGLLLVCVGSSSSRWSFTILDQMRFSRFFGKNVKGLRKTEFWRSVKKIRADLVVFNWNPSTLIVKRKWTKGNEHYLHEKGSGVICSPSKAKVSDCCLLAPLTTLLFMQFEFWLLRSFKLFSERLLSCSFSKGYNFLSKL